MMVPPSIYAPSRGKSSRSEGWRTSSLNKSHVHRSPFVASRGPVGRGEMEKGILQPRIQKTTNNNNETIIRVRDRKALKEREWNRQTRGMKKRIIKTLRGLLNVSRMERLSCLLIIRGQDGLVILRDMANRPEILHSPLHLHPRVPSIIPKRYHVRYHRDHLLRYRSHLSIFLPRPEAQFLVRRIRTIRRIAATCSRSERHNRRSEIARGCVKRERSEMG